MLFFVTAFESTESNLRRCQVEVWTDFTENAFDSSNSSDEPYRFSSDCGFWFERRYTNFLHERRNAPNSPTD